MGGQKFKCSICDASFTENGNMKKHIKSVHEGQKFKCSICDSSFTQSGDLKRHIATVHEKSFHCSICDASFARRETLKKHISELHMSHKLNVSAEIMSEAKVQLLSIMGNNGQI